MDDYYNGNKLLSLMDINGKLPEIYMCCGNRTAGKTFFFKRWMLRRFVKHGEKFVIFVRYIDDLPNVVDGFFADIGPLEFDGHTMTQKPIMHGKSYELYYDNRPCGYVVAVNDPERIKRNSAIFADAQRGFFDEFMSENDKYCPNEVQKLNSIRVSIARGGATGAHTRYFPVYMASNNVTIFNPYFEYFGVSARLQNNTHYLRGNGWVLEQTFNKAAAAALSQNFATINADEMKYMAENRYLLDRNTFVDAVPGEKYCMCKIRYNGKTYTVWGMSKDDLWYVSSKLKSDTRNIITVSPDDHDKDSILITRSHKIYKLLRQCYNDGLIRFDSGSAKHAFLSALSVQ